MQVHYNKRFSLGFVLKVLLLFGFLYPFSLKIIGVPEALHASRLASIGIVLFAIIKSSKISLIKRNPLYNEYKKVFRLILFTFFYSLLLSVLFGFGKGTNYLMLVSDNILFSLLPIGAFYCVFRDIDEFTDVIICVTFLQSVAIFLSTFIPGVSILFDVIFNYSAGYGERDIDLLNQSYASGIACFTSEGVTKFTIGLVACAYKYMSKRKVFYLALYLFFSVANSMLARTGMLMSILGVIFIFIYLFRENRINFAGVISILFLGLLSYCVLSGFSSDFYDRFSRYQEFRDGGVNNFFELYFHDRNTVIPPISLATIIGTSIISGESGNGIVVHTDGGFIKNYVALGLILTIIVYGYLLVMFMHIKKRFKNCCFQYVLLFYIMYIFLSDFKEYFLLFRGTISLFFLYVMFAANKYLPNGTFHHAHTH